MLLIAAEVKTEFGHDAFHLVFVLFVLVCHAEELVFEDWVDEDLVPGQAVFLVDLEAAFEETDCLRG